MDTNTIHVFLPPGESLHAATTAFRQFGDVSSLELLPGDMLVASVVFFDVRAAWHALETLGFELAQPAPQTGSRLAQLRGEMHLKVDDITGVSNVFFDSDSSDGTYMVEFYDTRSASWARQLAAQQLRAASGRAEDDDVECCRLGGISAQGLDTGEQGMQEPVPVYVIPSAVPPAVLSGAIQELEPTHFTVRNAEHGAAGEHDIVVDGEHDLIGNLDMFDESGNDSTEVSDVTETSGNDRLQAVLQQAELLEAAINFRMQPGESCGEAYVTFLSYTMAEQCVRHFQGRQWTTSGGEVSAWLQPSDSAAPGEWDGAYYSASDEVWRKRCDSSNTEASTDVGPPSELEEEREGDLGTR